MRYFVRIQGRAQSDVIRILDWLVPKSPERADRWHAAYLAATVDLANDPTRHALAPESKKFEYQLRQRSFKTKLGGVYRLLFVVIDSEVRVLRVRGPGQRPVRRAEIDL